MFSVALTRAANWLYVYYAQFHYRRGGYGGWSDWDDDGYRELTRFWSPGAQKFFDHQSASRFSPPQGVATSKPGSRSSRTSARKKDSSRRAGKG